MKNNMKNSINELFEELTAQALQMGVSNAALVSINQIEIDDKLAAFCKTPGCNFYGQCAKCPPHVSGPDGFRKLLKKFENALFFKIDIPTEILLSGARQDVFRHLHTVASELEHYAVDKGYIDSIAFAGGSCKNLFCDKYPLCNVLKGSGKCRNPHIARESMSGFGINVSKLMRSAGWELNPITKDTDSNDVPMGNVCGLVLTG